MRNIHNLQDVETELRDINTKLDLLSTGNLDFKKRRIKNASPSADLDDYVIRRELEDFKASVQQRASSSSPVQVGASKYDRAIFGIGINISAEVGLTVCPNHIVVAPFDLEIERAGREATILGLFVNAKTPPQGSVAIFEFWKNWGITTSGTSRTRLIRLELPTDEENVQLFNDFQFEFTTLIHRDTINIHTIQVGSDVAGSDIYFKLIYKWS